MTDNRVTLATGLFVAGAVACAVALVRTWLGYPVSSLELLVFVMVACTVTGGLFSYRIGQWLYYEDLLNAEKAFALDVRRAALETPLTAPAATPAVPTSVGQGDDETAEAMRLALDRFFRAGDVAGGFSIRKLDGVVGSDTWGRLVHFYDTAAGGNVLRDAGGDQGYQWGHGWRLDRALLALANGRLPFPPGGVPVVSTPRTATTRRHTARQRNAMGEAGGAIIDGKEK